MEMHDLAKYWKADEIAECLKVDDSTYKELWGCVKLYEDLPRGEAPGEYTYPLSKYGWDKLSEAAQIDVNRALAEKQADDDAREEERYQDAFEDPEQPNVI
jgi:hypothetical protein